MCISFWRSKILLSTFSLEKGRNCSKLSLQKGNPYVWTCNKTLFLRAYVANWWQYGSACPGVLGFAFDSLHILQWIYIWNPFLVGKMRLIQNIKKTESSSPLRKPVQYANRFMKWLFTGELAFDMLFIQLSWHCGKITFFCLFLIHTFIQFTNSNGANTTRSCRAAERTMHWTMSRSEHFSVLSTNETQELGNIFILQDMNFHTYFSRNKMFI